MDIPRTVAFTLHQAWIFIRLILQCSNLATRLRPTLHDAFYNWAIAIVPAKEKHNTVKMAVNKFRSAIQLQFDFHRAIYNLGTVLKIVDDWTKWISSRGGIGVPATKSWESWWDEEQEHLLYTGFSGRFWEIVLSLRFFLYQYGVVYHLHVANGDTSIMVYALSWLVIVAVVVILKIVSMGRKKFSADYQLMFRLLKLFLFIGFVVTLVLFFLFLNLTFGDIFVCLLAFLPTGWALLSIAIACKPLMKGLKMWSSAKALARGYDYLMGIIIFTPVAVLAWFPFISEFQTRLLFNQAFSRGLQIQRILAGGRKQK